MTKLKLFGDDKTTSANNLIREYRLLQQGEKLQRNEVFDFFYDSNLQEGGTIPVKSDDSFVFFHMNIADQIDTIIEEGYTLYLTVEEAFSVLNLILKSNEGDDTQYIIPLQFRHSDEKSLDIFRTIILEKQITVCLLSLLYGDIIKERQLTFDIPDHIIERVS